MPSDNGYLLDWLFSSIWRRILTQDKKKQITIKQAWDAIPNYYPTGATEQVTTTQRILKTWCQELMPWNLMRKPSIRKMFKKLNPRYKLPSATTFLETHIPEWREQRGCLMRLLLWKDPSTLHPRLFYLRCINSGVISNVLIKARGSAKPFATSN
jgi:hypothetical protein